MQLNVDLLAKLQNMMMPVCYGLLTKYRLITRIGSVEIAKQTCVCMSYETLMHSRNLGEEC